MKKAHLTREQRYTICAMNKQGCSQKMIAQAVGQDKSVICRELKRNATPKGRYVFEYAQDMAEIRKERAKRPRKLTPWLKRQIIALLERQWSPQRIRGRLKLEGKPSVSHETIYKMLREDKESGGCLYLHTRHRLKKRKRPQAGRIPVINRLCIEERPEIVNLKQRFGDWEMDTIIGGNGKGAMVTPVESTLPTSNADYWANKIASNIELDKKVQIQLEQMGYRVFIIWQCQLKAKEREYTLSNLAEKLSGKKCDIYKQ